MNRERAQLKVRRRLVAVLGGRVPAPVEHSSEGTLRRIRREADRDHHAAALASRREGRASS